MAERAGNLTKQWLIRRAIAHTRTGRSGSRSEKPVDLTAFAATGTPIPRNLMRRAETGYVAARNRAIVEAL